MFNFLKKQSKKRVFVLGLDGVPCSLLKRFMAEGIMPELALIVKEGALLQMEASLPEVSSTSWVTFMTGVNPGRHGIYGFMDLRPKSYEIYFPKFSDVKSETIWDILGRHKKSSVVLNIPSTYPARPLNGILTSGFVALDLEKATYPKDAYEYLKGIGYMMDVEAEKASQDLVGFKKDVDTALAKRGEAAKFFLKKQDWDLFISAVTETDRLHHFFYEAFDNNAHHMHGYLMDFYHKIDKMAGDLYSQVRNDNTAFLIISDHGFTGIKKEVYVNSWLKEKGYLSFMNEKPAGIQDIRPQSLAFALDPSRIYINREGKYPKGCVSELEYDSVRDKLRNEFLGLAIGGEKIIKNVFYKEEIYKGSCFGQAPDIVLLSYEGFDLKGALRMNGIFGKGIFSGAHTRSNATFFINKGIEANNINIVDIAPTILTFMGLGQEAGLLDGKEIK